MPKNTYAKYTDQSVRDSVSQSVSWAGVLRSLGIAQSGGNHSHIKRRAATIGVDFSHFTGQAHLKGKRSAQRLSPSDILVNDRNNGRREHVERLRWSMDSLGVERKCVDCGLEESEGWNGFKIRLEVDHIDRNPHNNVLSNLRYLCPNCHSQYGTVNHYEVVRTCPIGANGETRHV